MLLVRELICDCNSQPLNFHEVSLACHNPNVMCVWLSLLLSIWEASGSYLGRRPAIVVIRTSRASGYPTSYLRGVGFISRPETCHCRNPNVTGEWLSLLLRIREVLGLDLGRRPTILSFRHFPQFPQADVGIVLPSRHCRSLPHPFKFIIHE
jgi:hypothetical protein